MDFSRYLLNNLDQIFQHLSTFSNILICYDCSSQISENMWAHRLNCIEIPRKIKYRSSSDNTILHQNNIHDKYLRHLSCNSIPGLMTDHLFKYRRTIYFCQSFWSTGRREESKRQRRQQCTRERRGQYCRKWLICHVQVNAGLGCQLHQFHKRGLDKHTEPQEVLF